MTTLFIIYLATSYSFSGWVCSKMCLKSESLSPTEELSEVHAKLTQVRVAILWPLWMIRESQSNAH